MGEGTELKGGQLRELPGDPVRLPPGLTARSTITSNDTVIYKLLNRQPTSPSIKAPGYWPFWVRAPRTRNKEPSPL